MHRSKDQTNETASSLPTESAPKRKPLMSPSRILQLFRTIDAKNRGYIDHESLAAHILPRGACGANQTARLRFAKDLLSLCDTSADGKITVEEFAAFIEEQERELWDLYQKIDLESDGLCAQDLQKALRQSGIHVHENELVAFIKHIDADNDGIVEFKDWLEFLMLLPNEPNIQNVFKYFLDLQSTDSGDPILLPPSKSVPLKSVSAEESSAQPSSPAAPVLFDDKTYRYLIAGGIAGAFSRTVTAPIDRLKILLQISTSPSARSTKEALKETSAVLRQIYYDGGVLAFWRGNTVNVAKIFPESGIRFYVFEATKRYIVASKYQSYAQNGVTEDQLNDIINTKDRLLAGGLAGLVSQAAIYPLETIKTRVMAELNKSIRATEFTAVERQSIPEVVKEIWRQHGIRGFFRGLGPSLIGIVPYAGIDLTLYETFKRAYSSFTETEQLSPFIHLTCGALSGCISASIVYPLGLIRTRLQAQGTSTHKDRYPRGAIDVIQRTWKKESWRGFYRGLIPNLVKVVPAVSLSYITYEQVKKVLGLV